MSATQGDLNLAKELLSELTLDYSSATSRIELGRFYLLLALLSIEIGEPEKAKNSILKAKMFFAEIPSAVIHSLDAELIGFEVGLRAIPISNLNGRSKFEARSIRKAVQSIKGKCKQMPYFRLRCNVLIAVSYFLEEKVGKTQSLLKTISDEDKQLYRRFFLSMSSIAPLGCERSAKELGIRSDVLINKSVMALFSEFLLGNDTIDSVGKLLGTVLASREKVEVRIIEESFLEDKNPYYTFEELSSDTFEVRFLLKQKTIVCEVLLPLSRPEWDSAVSIQLNMITTILQYIENKNAVIENEKINTFNSVAKQVAHDIRSPLAALNSLLVDTKEVPESKRIILRTATNRINDIANNLLLSQKNNKTAIDQSSVKSVELISARLDSLISEKRIQFRNKSGVTLEGDLNAGYGLFAEIIPSEFQRVISNLINNSVEAFENDLGNIKLSVEESENSILISVSDNGKGIPPHVLSKLGNEEVTFGKENSDSGSGIGVYHGRKTIESFGGSFKIESQVGKGTTILIRLPKAPAPRWFVKSINCSANTTIVCVDDDQAIHQIWQSKFPDNKIHHFTSPKVFEVWWHAEGKVLENKIVLIDYEFLNHQINGIGIIENLKIKNDTNTDQVILVTSHYEEKVLQNRAEEIGIPVLPKGMAALIPIQMNSSHKSLNAVLIDDDPLVRLTWEFAAKDSGSSILTFESFESFIKNAHNISRETPVSVDMNLGNGIRGTDIALKLHKMGFKWIYLATGYEAEGIEDIPSCVVAVRGKDPLFAQNKSTSVASKAGVEVIH